MVSKTHVWLKIAAMTIAMTNGSGAMVGTARRGAGVTRAGLTA